MCTLTVWRDAARIARALRCVIGAANAPSPKVSSRRTTRFLSHSWQKSLASSAQAARFLGVQANDAKASFSGVSAKWLA